MTETEKQAERDIRADAESKLARLSKRNNAKLRDVWSTDKRIKQYLQEIAQHPDEHCLNELLAVVRFYYLIDKYNWDVRAAKLRISTFESLRFDNDSGLVRIRLEPVQVFMIAPVYGLVDDDGHRVINSVFWMVPRKFGKSTIIAGLASAEFLFGPYDAEIDVAANSYKQAQICFGMIKKTLYDLDCGPDDKPQKLRVNRENIFYDNPMNGGAKASCWSSNPKTLDGLKASHVIIDEWGSAEDTASKAGADLKNVLVSSMGVREEPLLFEITTASQVVNGPCVRELVGIRKILRGESFNDGLWAFVFEPDVDDDIGDPKTWHKVHPMLGKTVREKFYRDEWIKAQNNPDSMVEFKTKLLNIFAVNEKSCWIAPEYMDKYIAECDPLNLQIHIDEAKMAIDLSESGDMTAISTCMYSRETREMFFYTKYFMPDGMEESEEADGQIHSAHDNRKLYQVWADQGHLELTHGPVINYNRVVDYVLEVAEKISITGIGYDRWRAKDVINMLKAAGGERFLKEIPQTFGHFTAPCEFFEHGTKTGKMFFHPSPITRFCFQSAVLATDNIGNTKPMKREDSNKVAIDGLITMVMCCKLWIDNV